MPDCKHQFTHSANRRRSSVVVGSLGRSGFLAAGDFARSDPESQSLLSPQRVISRELLQEEADLLRDNHVLDDALEGDAESVENAWSKAVESNAIDTSIKRELEVLVKSSFPLIATFLLQNSCSVMSIFFVGHIGSKELAGVTLATMTLSITAISMIQGLAASLDTFLPQSYGAGNHQNVGVYLQKCTALILTIMLPVVLGYILFSRQVLSFIIPDEETAQLAASYLAVLAPGIPGFVFWETGKRFLQAQGIFHASTLVLSFCAPLNLLLNYLLVWSKPFGIGYLGAGLAVSINYWMMAFALLGYIFFTKHEINPRKCWNGLQIAESFSDWDKLLRLALPSVIMVEAEFLPFEILTLSASYLGTTNLAAQSVVSTMASLTFQVPFAIAVASSTRVANFLGAGLSGPAAKCCKTSLIFGQVVSVINLGFLFFLRYPIARLFTGDEKVISTVVNILPVVAMIQIFDALNAVSAGCLRGQGQPKIGGIVNLVSYYFFGLPLSLVLTFKYDVGLLGLWIGVGAALLIIGFVQAYFVLTANYKVLVQEASKRSS